MLATPMSRAKASKEMVNFNARVPLALREKATIAAALLDSDLSKEARKFLKELVAKAEAAFGVLPVEASSTPKP